MSYKLGDVLYKKGDFEVRLEKDAADTLVYKIKNITTEVWEHESKVLYECMKLTDVFDYGINNIRNPQDWSKDLNPSVISNVN